MLQNNKFRIASKFIGGPLDGEILPILNNVIYVEAEEDEISKNKFMYEKIDSEFIYQGFVH